MDPNLDLESLDFHISVKKRRNNNDVLLENSFKFLINDHHVFSNKISQISINGSAKIMSRIPDPRIQTFLNSEKGEPK